jgi:Uma2 family endonuclease
MEGKIMAQRESPNITVNDYLTLDQNSLDARYEYLEGELRMLAGGSPDHSLITTNVTSLLHALLRNGHCLVYNVDMKLQLSESRYVYPNITISCDPRDVEPEDNRTHYPSVVVEVLSPSTEMVDRGKKLLYYQAHATIQDYLMIDSQRILVEVYHREKAHWTHTTYKLEDNVPIESLAIHFSVIDAYEKTSLLRKATKEQ